LGYWSFRNSVDRKCTTASTFWLESHCQLNPRSNESETLLRASVIRM
jgi:hypothetical protein